MLEFADTFFRNGATAMFILIAVLVVRAHGVRLVTVLAALASLTAAGYTICTLPGFMDMHPAFMIPVAIFCQMGPVHVWLFSLSQFQDDFRLRGWHWGLAILYTVVMLLYDPLVTSAVTGMISDLVLTLLRGFFILHMVFAAWQGRGGELTEARRRFRLMFIVLVSLVSTVILLMESVYPQDALYTPFISIMQATSFCLLASVILWHMVQMKQDVLYIPHADAEKARHAPAAPASSTQAGADAADSHDLAAITAAMQDDGLYMQQGMSISVLSDVLSIPEHRLRRLINQHMGYRNFADFLNEYRITAAENMLADTDRRHTQILTIAMDLGYGSLGPFNRAFKARTGKTPTAFRRAALGTHEGDDA